MANQTSDAHFRAHTENVQELAKAIIQVRRAINNAIRKKDAVGERLFTKMYALIFNAWVEAGFQKLIHTPFGFSQDDLKEIERRNVNMEAGWIACVEIRMNLVFGEKNTSFKPNAQQALRKLINQHIQAPYIFRNKIAHGEWVNAFNSSGVNVELSEKLKNLDIVCINNYVEKYKLVSDLIELLIESPKRKFHVNYFSKIENMKEEFKRIDKITYPAHRANLLSRPLKRISS